MSVATLGRINLSGIAKKAEKSKTEYPKLEDDRAKELAGLILKLNDEAEAITANLEINKADLRSLVVPEFFRRFKGVSEIPSSMAVPTDDGREVLVSLTAKYKKPTDANALVSTLGVHAERYLKPSFKLAIDSEKIPRDKQQDVVNALVSVLEVFECAAALSATESTDPIESFHKDRHMLFTPEENMAIENVMPMVVAVKTKGRK